MPRERPVSMLVLAIFQILFGLFAICGGLMVVFGVQEQLAAAQANAQGNQPFTQQKLEDYIEAKNPGYNTIKRVQGGGGLVLGLLMILGAVGLLVVQPWGWYTTMLYAVGSLLNFGFSMVYLFSVVLPTIYQYADTEVPKLVSGNQAQAMAVGMKAGATAPAVLQSVLLIYPIVVLILLMLPGVRRAYGGRASEPAPRDEWNNDADR